MAAAPLHALGALRGCPGGGRYLGHVTVSTSGPVTARVYRPVFRSLPEPTGRCLVCEHVINIPKADWSSVKNKQLTATPC